MLYETLYETKRLEKTFGKHFCGPNELPHGTSTLVAQYKETFKDGYNVNVYAFAWPAKFYKLEIRKNDELLHTINTGSGQDEIAAKIAEMFADGLLGIE